MTAGVAPSGPYVIKGSTLPGRRACRRSRTSRRTSTRGAARAGARVPVARQGPGARADHGRRRLRPEHRRGRRRAVRPGRREAGAAARPPGLVSRRVGVHRSEHDRGSAASAGPRRTAMTRTSPTEVGVCAAGHCRGAPAAVSLLVLPAGARSSSASSSSLPTVAVVLLQPDPLDAVRRRVHRPRQLRPVPRASRR